MVNQLSLEELIELLDSKKTKRRRRRATGTL